MGKFETEKIDLAPLNLDQIRLNSQLLGIIQNKLLPLTALQIHCLELMQKRYSIAEISQEYLRQGRLISFSQLKELLIFLVMEKLIQNQNILKYLTENTPKISKTPGFLSQLFRGSSQKVADLPDRIRQIPFFRSLTPETVDLFLSHHRVIECPANIKVCEAGSRQRSLLCVLEGSLSIFKKDSKGNSRRVADLSPGTVFGEAGFFLDQMRTADVITNSESLIVKFKYIPEVFDHIIKKEKAQSLQKRIWLIHAMLASLMFKDLPDDSFDSLIYAGELKNFKAGSLIFNEGQTAQSFFIIVQGDLQVLQNQKSIRTLQQGDCFGEVSLLLTGGLRTASVLCRSEALLLEISIQNFYQLLGHNLLLASEFEKLALERVQADQQR